MPFTPFHLGAGLLIGMLFRKWINLPAILAASIIVDIRAAYCFFTGCYPLHGILHTFFGAAALAIPLIIIIYILRAQLSQISNLLKIPQDYTLSSIVLGSFAGVWVHILLDSFLYTDMHPFYPSGANPLFGMFTGAEVYGFCCAGFLIGGLIYIFNLMNYNN